MKKFILVLIVVLGLAGLAVFSWPDGRLGQSQLAAVGAGLPSARVIGGDTRALIQYPTYSTSKVYDYQADGTKQTITGGSVKSFLKSHVDLEIGGLKDYGDNQIILRYQQLNGVYREQNADLYNLVKDDETAFVHGRGLPATKENRLIHRSYSSDSDPQYLTNPVGGWGAAFISYQQQIFAGDSRLDGMFLDNTLGVLTTNYSTGNEAARYIRKVFNQPFNLEAGADKITPDPNYLVEVPTGYYQFANPITVRDDAGADYFAGRYDEHNIYLSAPLTEAKTLYATYYVIDQPDQSVVDNWGSNTQSLLASLKSAFPNKLVTYNGVHNFWTEDNGFPAVSDGGMAENFIYEPGGTSVNAAPNSVSLWRQFVDELQSISADRLYLAQAGAIASPTNSGQDSALRQKAMFTFASYLLGKGRYGYFNFATSPGSYQNFLHFAYWDVPTGASLESYHARSDNSNVYQRDYNKLLVLVNPGSGSQTLSLGATGYGSYWDYLGVLKTWPANGQISLPGGGAVLAVKGTASTLPDTQPLVVPPPVPEECTSSWSCSAWSACSATAVGVSGTQTRTCTKIASCPVETASPSLSRSCTFNELPPEEMPAPASIITLAPLTSKYAIGQTGEHVRHLQIMLAQDPTLNAPAPSGFYGPETVAAVLRFQQKYGIPTTPETAGLAGPVTRAKLNELYANKAITGGADNANLILVLQTQLLALLQQLKTLLENR